MADINEILEKVDIVDVVSEYVDLERKGKNFFGVCPFHDDNNPSMSVSPQKQLFKCFSCGAGGNAVTFVMNIENVGFRDAAAILGKSVGIEVANTYKQIKDDYFNIYLDATKYFMYSLYHTKLGEKYLKYLEKREFDYEVLNYFNIGISNQSIMEPLLKKYAEQDIKKTGLANASNNLVFKSRIVFPIADQYGNVVGFSGRVINDATPKYLNTAETKYFKKSNLLYNFYRASSAIHKSKSVVITEGFFDVMRLHTIGVHNAVATMGTAFTEYHAKMIGDICDVVYLSMDGDSAGVNASLEIFKSLLNYDLKVFMVELDSLDPDEFIVQRGKEKYLHSMKYAKVFEEYYLDYLMNGYVDLNVGDKEVVISNLASFIKMIKSPVVSQLLVGYVYDSIGVTINVNHQSSVNLDVKKATVKPRSHTSINESLHSAYVLQNDAINKIELEFLSMILQDRSALEAYVNEIKVLNIKRNDELAMLIRAFYIQNEYSDLLEYIQSRKDDYNESQLETLEKLMVHVTSQEINCNKQLVEDYVRRIILYRYDKKIDEISKDVANEKDVEYRKELLLKITKLKIDRNIIEEKGKS